MNTDITTEDWIAQESAHIKSRIERKAKTATTAVLKKISADAAKWHAEQKERREKQEQQELCAKHAVRIAELLKQAFEAGCAAYFQRGEWRLVHGGSADMASYAGFLKVHDYLRSRDKDADGAYGPIPKEALELLRKQGMDVPSP